MENEASLSIPSQFNAGDPISARWANSVTKNFRALISDGNPSTIYGFGRTLPPLWANFEQVSSTDYELYLTDGKVIARNNNPGDCVTTWDIGSIPTIDTPLTITAATKIMVEVSEDANGVVTAAEFVTDTTWLESLAPNGVDAGYRYYRIAEIIDDPDSTGYLKCNQIMTGHIDHFQTGGAGGSGLHPWKVTKTGTAGVYAVALDDVQGQGGPITPTGATVDSTETSGYIYLKIERDTDTRVLVSAVVEFAAALPDSDYTYQYRPIAFVDGADYILQLQFEEIRIYELMLVSLGAFSLASFEMSVRSTYDPP